MNVLRTRSLEIMLTYTSAILTSPWKGRITIGFICMLSETVSRDVIYQMMLPLLMLAKYPFKPSCHLSESAIISRRSLEF